jgi:hypothetical protein
LKRHSQFKEENVKNKGRIEMKVGKEDEAKKREEVVMNVLLTIYCLEM